MDHSASSFSTDTQAGLRCTRAKNGAGSVSIVADVKTLSEVNVAAMPAAPEIPIGVSYQSAASAFCISAFAEHSVNPPAPAWWPAANTPALPVRSAQLHLVFWCPLWPFPPCPFLLAGTPLVCSNRRREHFGVGQWLVALLNEAVTQPGRR